jgi:hypothetical protein
MYKYWLKILNIHNIPITNNMINNLINDDFENIEEIINENPKAVYKGGGKILHKYKNEKYVFFKSKDNINTIYSIKELNDEKEMDCILISIEKNTKTAIINNISGYEKCINDNRQINGSDLLDVSIDFIKFLKNKYDLKKIRLKDNSFKSCKGGKKIELSRFYILLYGHTWYGSRGFRPYTKKIGINVLAEYDINLNINKRTKIKHAVNLVKYLEEFYNKNTDKDKLIKWKNIIDENILFIKNNPEVNLGKYLEKFLKDYDKNCIIFSSFYEKLFVDLEYADFYTDGFELKL